MLWEVEIRPAAGEVDRDGLRVVGEAHALGVAGVKTVTTARSFLLQGASLNNSDVTRAATTLLVDPVAEIFSAHQVSAKSASSKGRLLNVLFKPGVTDNVALSTQKALADLGFAVDTVATGRKYWFEADVSDTDLDRIAKRVLANDAIERVIAGPLQMDQIGAGSEYKFQLRTVPIRTMNDDALMHLSKHGQLYLSLAEMLTIKTHWVEQQRDPTDIELESVAQTWSEHCSHKTLKGRIRYRDENGEHLFENMLKETVFGATVAIREKLGADDWCVSVFKDNAGVVKFDDEQNVCFKVETHNHPSAIEPYGGANTGLGGVIRDPLGTGLGAKPICNTDVFCFAPPDTPYDALPPGTLHPKLVMKGVVSGVRDYGNRMGIPTVNGSVFFDERYLGNPLVYCGTAAMIPVDKVEKEVHPGDLIVAVGGRTGRDGIHGATFSSAELTHESETISGGAVQIGNAVTEKMVMDVILQARDKGLYHAITDCGAGGFSSAVGEMGEHTGAVVWLDKCPLKYAGLSYTEIWISEAQERMVLAVPEQNWEEFRALCAAEGVEATAFGQFGNEGRLKLTYHGEVVGDVAMSFLHDGRPPVVRDATYTPPNEIPLQEFSGSLRDFLDVIGYAPVPELNEHLKEEVESQRLTRAQRESDAKSGIEHAISAALLKHFGEDANVEVHVNRLTDSPIVKLNGREVEAEELGKLLGVISAATAKPLMRERIRESASAGHSRLSASLSKILGSLNVCSKEWIIRQYDHEVQSGSVIKPLVGVACDGPSDAAVVRPNLKSQRGVVVSNGMNPHYGDFDPYWMAAAAIDEAVRNCVAVGADPSRIAILDNFCWGNTERPETLGSLVRAALGCKDTAIAFGTPFISGKDSLNNEFSYVDASGQKQTVAIPSSLLISALGQVEDVRKCVTMDLKAVGNVLYQIGITKNELGGSHFALVNGLKGGTVPHVNLQQAPKIFVAVHKAIENGLLKSCHDLSEGGLAVAAAEMAFAGGFGVELDLSALASSSTITDPAVLLYSESTTRFLVEVTPESAAKLEALFQGLPITKIGKTTSAKRVQAGVDGKQVLDADCAELKAAWLKPLAWE
ncbi:MAG: phosphoribosylformylglycinamidine synthase [Schlesneria sp.]|nr:phosphoribosylformylglycinamidine synthase [Schlesneria sp.]